jgi:O-antigen ligase
MKGHLHPHNAVFQVWSELGLPGAILLGGLLASLLRRIAALRRWSQAFALAAFSAGFVIAYVSHGAWQAWWLAAIALTIAWFAVVVPAEREIPPTAEVR